MKTRPTLATVLVVIAVSNFSLSDAAAQSERQAVAFYGGPATRKFVSQIAKGNFDIDGLMLGLAYERRLASLGAGFSFEAEAELTHFFMSQSYTTVAGGLGLRYDMSGWIGHMSSLAFYTGPSYADDPVRNGHYSGRFLEYVAVEFAVANIYKSQWDGVIRLFHRSGAFGLYGTNTDTGSMLGIGVRRRF